MTILLLQSGPGKAGAGGAPSSPLDGVASVTGAWSFSRNLLTGFSGARYTKASGSSINAFKDQSGNSRDFAMVASVNQPLETTSFPTSVLCAAFNGSNAYMQTTAVVSDFIAAGSGALVVSAIVNSVSVNSSTSYLNHPIIGDSGGYFGLFAANSSGVTIYGYNYDTSEHKPLVTGAVGTPYVIMWRHNAGNVYVSINGGAEVSAASGNTGSLTHNVLMGAGTSTVYCNMTLAEAFFTSDGSQTAALASAIANMKTYIGAAASFDGTPSSQVALTNNNLTATTTGTGANIGVRSASLQTTGKYYFEVLAGTQAFSGNLYNCGILTSAGSYNNAWQGSNCFTCYTNGNIFSNNANQGSIATWTTGDIVCFAVDLAARLGWVRKNNGAWNGSGTANPATGVGGFTIAPTVSFSPMASFGNGAFVGDVFTGNFGATAYAQTPPSGFGNWSS